MKVQVNHNPAPRQLYFNFEEPVLKPVEKDSDIPMYMKQFKDLKAKHPDALLLFRTGDFYTSFEEDAVNAADSLGITLTKSKGFRQASFPHHALDTYLPLSKDFDNGSYQNIKIIKRQNVIID